MKKTTSLSKPFSLLVALLVLVSCLSGCAGQSFSDGWQSYDEFETLKYRNCRISSASPIGSAITLVYYPICPLCGEEGAMSFAAVSVTSPTTAKNHMCSCFAEYEAQFKLEA